MTEWREFKLGDICTIIQYGYTESATFDPVGPKFLRITDIVPNIIDWSTVPYCKIDKENYEKYKLDVGDIVIARTGATTGYNKRIKDSINAVFASYLIRFKINKEIADDCFISYVLKSDSYFGFIDNAVGGSAQPGINARVLSQFSFLLPPLPEQKAIAEVLSSLDDKIDLLTRQNKTLEDLAQAYFRKWFIEDIHNKICYKRFADVVEFSKGKKPREIIEEQRKGYVRQILIDTFDTDKEYYTRPEGMIISTETDILMVMDGASSGRVEIGFSGVVGSTIGMFRPKSDFKYPMFLYEFLKSNEEFIMDNTTGSAIPHADKKLIFELEIPYFQEEKIQEFENFALVLFNKRQNNRRQIRTLTKLRDTLLPKLISGEIRVKM